MTVSELVIFRPSKKAEINRNTDPEKPQELDLDSTTFVPVERCGLGCFSPTWIQDYAAKNVFLVAFMFLSVIQGMVFSYFTGTLSTLQKRFKISSETAGFLFTANELSQVLLSVLISYYGSKAHRTRWIAFGVLLNAISCYAMATIHLLYGSGEEALALTGGYPPPDHPNSSDVGQSSLNYTFVHLLHPCIWSNRSLCQPNLDLSPAGVTDEDEMSLTPLVIIFLSQVVHGIGGLFFWIFGGPYLDDNLKRTSIPMLFGVSASLRLVGPTFGYLVASGSLKLYVNPMLTPTVTSEDPRWIGAWWLGWIVIGTLLLLTSLVIALFPRKLRRKSVDEYTEVSELSGHQRHPQFSEMPEALIKLLKNKVYVCNNLAAIFYIFSALGYWTYMPKYMETIFMQSAATASIMSGAVGIVSQASGLLISGFMISKFQFSPRQLSTWNICTGLLHVVTILYFIRLGCDRGQFSIGGQNPDGTYNLTQPCNASCQCPTREKLPVCHPDGNIVFYSPCHPGCQSYDEQRESMSNCTCLSSPSATVLPGNCSSSCGYAFLTFLVVNALVKFIDSTGRIGNMLVSYRCVTLDERSISIGLHMTFLCAFAFIPAPVAFGKIIDSVCLVWGGGGGNHGKGNCMFYDGKELRFLFNSFAAALLFVGVFFDCSVWYFVKGLDLYKEPQTDTIEEFGFEKEQLIPNEE